MQIVTFSTSYTTSENTKSREILKHLNILKYVLASPYLLSKLFNFVLCALLATFALLFPRYTDIVVMFSMVYTPARKPFLS